MNKPIFFAGLVLALVFLVQVNSGWTGNDVFQIMQNTETEEDDLVDLFLEEPPTPAPVTQQVKEEVRLATGYYEVEENEAFDTQGSRAQYGDHVYGTLLAGDLEKNAELMASLISRLQNSQEVKTFVILAENHDLKGNDVITSSEYGFATQFGKVEPDFDLMEKLEMSSSYGALKDEPMVSNFMPFIKKYFPEARVMPVVIKDFASDEEVQIFAEKLAEAADENVVVILSTELANDLDDFSNSFHNELNRTILESLDSDDLTQTDVESRQVLLTGMDYFKDVGAKRVISGSPLLFYSGETFQDRDLTILAFGDMMLGRYVRTLMNEYGKDYIFRKIRGRDGLFFEGADVIFGNLEGPIKGSGKSGGTSMNFAFNEDVAPFLFENGFNLVSIANNHALDQGWEGRETTIAALDEAGLDWCGHPTNEFNMESVYYGNVGEKKYAFVCFQGVTDELNVDQAVALIKEVRPKVDFLVVSVHWGIEYKHYPNDGLQVNPAHAFVDAGADFVIGHHPHVVESFEVYKDRFIFYSLGNFVFDQYWSTETQEELAIGIVLDDKDDEGLKSKVYLFPMKSERSQSRLMFGEERAHWIEEFIGYAGYSDEMKEMIRAGVLEIR